ncbi:MAG: sensor histidine kinase [Chloroflexia bacterium]
MTRRIFLPIRLRLALWYSLLLGLVLVLVSVLVYTVLTGNLDGQLDASLAASALQVGQQSRVAVGSNGLTVFLPRPDMTESDIFVQVADPRGVIVQQSPNLGGSQLPVSQAAQGVASGGSGYYETIWLGSQKLRLYNAPLVVEGRAVGLIQSGRLLAQVDNTAAGLRQQLIQGDALALLVALILGWVVSGQALRPLERVSRTAEQIGEERDFSRRVRYRGPSDEVGRLAGTFDVMLDQLEGAYADQQKASHRLESALAAQQRFVSDASHELRTPLTAIRGNAELLQRVPNMEPEDRRESVAQIASEAQRMSRLVGDLLELARADAGQHLRRETLAFGPIVCAAAAAARHLQGGERLAARTPPAGAVVVGDSDYLKQLLLILLDNALKYTPPEGRVELITAVRDGQVEISVADSGCGIAAEDLPHIFERFYRADRARAAGGTGIGLAIAGWIAGEHGGRIKVESTPGAGSTFTIILPMPAEAVAGPPAESPVPDFLTTF